MSIDNRPTLYRRLGQESMRPIRRGTKHLHVEGTRRNRFFCSGVIAWRVVIGMEPLPTQFGPFGNMRVFHSTLSPTFVILDPLYGCI